MAISLDTIPRSRYWTPKQNLCIFTWGVSHSPVGGLEVDTLSLLPPCKRVVIYTSIFLVSTFWSPFFNLASYSPSLFLSNLLLRFLFILTLWNKPYFWSFRLWWGAFLLLLLLLLLCKMFDKWYSRHFLLLCSFRCFWYRIRHWAIWIVRSNCIVQNIVYSFGKDTPHIYFSGSKFLQPQYICKFRIPNHLELQNIVYFNIFNYKHFWSWTHIDIIILGQYIFPCISYNMPATRCGILLSWNRLIEEFEFLITSQLSILGVKGQNKPFCCLEIQEYMFFNEKNMSYYKTLMIIEKEEKHLQLNLTMNAR